MKSKTIVMGHPLHPIVVALPLALYLAGALFDMAYWATNSSEWVAAAFWTMALGHAGAIIAIPVGVRDWLAIPRETRARTIGLWHGIVATLFTGVFVASWLLRLNAIDHAPSLMARLLSVGGMLLVPLVGWLGGELIYRLGVSVEPEAHLNAPSSL